MQNKEVYGIIISVYSEGAVFTDKLQVFISYSSADKERAEVVCDYLEKNGKKCWIAPRDITAGAEYGAEIINGIETSDVMAVIFSKTANDSQHVLREIERAVNKKMPIIVFKIEECTLSKSMEYFLLSNQWLDATSGVEGMLPMLSTGIDTMYGKTSSVNRQEVIVTPGSTIHVTSRTVTVLLAVIAAGIICVAGALIVSSVINGGGKENEAAIAAAATTVQSETAETSSQTQTETATETEAETSADASADTYADTFETEETLPTLESYEPAYKLSETILTTDPTGTFELYSKNMVRYNVDETASIDLDGDGKEETISFAIEGDINPAVLTVNGAEIDTAMKASPYFWVCDICLADGMKEVAIASGWYSDHYTTYFYRFYDNSLIYMGSVEDMIDDSTDEGNVSPLGSETYISGDDSVETPKRLNIFQSWSAYTSYRLSEQTGTLEESRVMYYPYGIENSSSYKTVSGMLNNSNTPIPSLNREINIYVEKDTEKGAIRLKPQHVIATATDDLQWVYLVAEDGTRGWLFMHDKNTAVDPLTGTKYTCAEIFDDLPMYG